MGHHRLLNKCIPLVLNQLATGHNPSFHNIGFIRRLGADPLPKTIAVKKENCRIRDSQRLRYGLSRLCRVIQNTQLTDEVETCVREIQFSGIPVDELTFGNPVRMADVTQRCNLFYSDYAQISESFGLSSR